MDRYILDGDGNPVKEPNVAKWEKAFEGDRHIGIDKIGDADVSTVFLAMDHSFGEGPPVLWETMVFGGPLDQEQARYSSKADALAGHAAMCERVRRAAG